MILTLILSLLTLLGVFTAVLVKPQMRIGRVTFGTHWPVSVLGAVLLLVCGCLPIGDLLSGITADTEVNPLKILVLFFCMTGLSVFLDEIGFFRTVAAYALRHAGKSQLRLFLMLYLTVAVLTVFTSNDIVVLTFTPFICLFAKNAKISPIPYLVGEFVAANTWSMMLMIGNPTNIYLVTSAGVDFVAYFRIMALPTVCGGAISLATLLLIFAKKLREPITFEAMEIPRVEDRVSLIFGLSHLLVCTAFLAFGSYVGLPMWLVSLACFVSLLIGEGILFACRRQSPFALMRTVRRLPFDLVPFLLSMFCVVLALSHNGWTDIFAEALSGFSPVFCYGTVSTVCANLMNNIPMSVLASSVIASVPSGAAPLYASVVGSNLGAYLTPVGALAGIMWMYLLRRFEVRFRFIDFIRYGAAVCVPTLAATLGTLWLIV